MRIIAHMVVGPGEADRYLKQVLERMFAWADTVFVAIDNVAGPDELEIVRSYADSWQVMDRVWADHEGLFRQEAWEKMEIGADPEPGDFIVLIDADEVIHEYSMVRQAAREYPDQRLAFKFHEMWSPNQFRIDGHWKPYDAWVMIPFVYGGRFKDRPIACGREPTYANNLPKVGSPIASLLHYGYAREEDRQMKHDRYMELDGGKYHSLSHLKSILRPPSLMEWEKGGLLNV